MHAGKRLSGLGGCQQTHISPLKRDLMSGVALILRHCDVLNMYASFQRILCALHLHIFQQPLKFQYSDRLLASKGSFPSPAFYCSSLCGRNG
jgi:hypothetical protein